MNSLNENGNKIILDFGIMDFKTRDGLIVVPEYFNLPQEYYRMGCFVCASIKTSDNKYLMVELSGKSMNSNNVDQIGGIMETNIEMKSGGDIFQSLYKELEEEAGITQRDMQECYLQTIYITDKSNVAFYFEIILNISSVELLERFKNNKDADIKSLCVYSRDEYLNVLKNHNSLSKKFTVDLLKI